MAETRVDLDVVAPRQRVDRPVAAGHGAGDGLLLAQPDLVAPVEALLVRAVGGLQPQLPADVADVGVGEVRDETAERVRRPRRVGVGERDDRSVRVPDAGVLRDDLAAARARQQTHPRLAGRRCLHDLVRAIVRRIRRNEDPQLLRRVVETEQVVEPPLDHGLLVVGRDDDVDVGQIGIVLPHWARPKAGNGCSRSGIAEMGPGERTERAPEERLQHRHKR